MADNHQLELFPDFSSQNIKTKDERWINYNGIFMPNNHFSLSLCEHVNFTSTYQMPVVQACHVEQPKDIRCYYRLRNRSVAGTIPHFYTNDSKLLPFLGEPYRYYDKICHHKTVIGIDISIKHDMPTPMKIAISFYNKLLMAWWHYMGLTVVPNVIVDSTIVDICLDGYPMDSVIAINSTSLGKDARARQLWQETYPQIIEALKPTHIIRYGGKQPNEAEHISSYYDNDNKKSARNGWE